MKYLFLLFISVVSIRNSAIQFLDCTFGMETDKFYHDYRLYSNNDSLFLLNGLYESKNDTSYLKIYQLKPNKKSFNVEANHVKHPSIIVNSFIIKDNYLFYNELFTLFIYKFIDNKFYYLDSIKFDKFIDYMHYDTGKLYLSSCFYSPEFNKTDSAANLFIVNLNDYNKYTEINFPSPNGIKYTLLQPRKLIDYNNNLITIADANKYRILVYNINGELIDSIKRNKNCFYEMDSDLLNMKITKTSLVENFSKRCMISHINFINSSLLLVSYQSPPKNDNMYYDNNYDLWKKENGEWNLIEKDVQLRNLSEDNDFNPKYFGISSSYIVNDNIISLISPEIPFPLNDKFKSYTMKQFIDSTNNYYTEKNFSFSILRFIINVQ